MKKKTLIAAVCVIAVAAIGSGSRNSSNTATKKQQVSSNSTKNEVSDADDKKERKSDDCTISKDPSENIAHSNQQKSASDIKVQDIPENHTLDDYSLDKLQKLYLAINPSMSYLDAIQTVQDSGLPYSDEKYNGSRMIQVAFTEGCTAQKYKKESGDFLEISFDYPRNENSMNDVLSKYFFSFCKYCPASGATLTSYCGDVGNCIEDYKNDTSDLPDNMTKEDQLLYYFEHRD